MKTKRLLGLLLLILSITGFVACSDDEPQDKVETVKMFISDKTGTYQPWGSDSPIDCMLVKEESESDYKTLDFQGITDFVYEKGYEYALWVEKRTLVNPPADGSSIVYKLIDVISKAKVEYEYTIKVDGPNPFILSPEGGEYEIPFTCKAKKFAEGSLVEDGYISLKGLRYNMGTNYGGLTRVVKDGEKVGFYKFVIEGIPRFNMKAAPVWYCGIYTPDADLLFGPEPEPIYKQLFEQPQTEGEDYFMYSVVFMSTGTFAE